MPAHQPKRTTTQLWIVFSKASTQKYRQPAVLPAANLLTCCHPLELLIAAEQALASRVRCACLSLVRARSLPDQLPKRPVMQSDGITLAFHGETATRLN
jgi:hypothetical protein